MGVSLFFIQISTFKKCVSIRLTLDAIDASVAIAIPSLRSLQHPPDNSFTISKLGLPYIGV